MSSVKERVALWESKATGPPSNPVAENKPKVISSAINFNSKPEQPKQNVTQSNHLYHVEETTILKPSDLKKRQSLGSNTLFNNSPAKPLEVKPIYKPQTSSPNNHQKPTVVQAVEIKKTVEPTQNSNIEVEVPAISKPSDIKKKLEETGKGIYFTPPVETKKIEQPHTHHNEHYEVETTNSVNVKQNAKKLDMFYSHKQEPHPPKLEQVQQPSHGHTQTHQPTEQAHTHPQHDSRHMAQSDNHAHHPQEQAIAHHNQTNNTMNVEANQYEDSFAMLQHHPNDKPKEEEKPKETGEGQKGADNSMVLRLQNRKKQNRKAFESDSD